MKTNPHEALAAQLIADAKAGGSERTPLPGRTSGFIDSLISKQPVPVNLQNVKIEFWNSNSSHCPSCSFQLASQAYGF